MTTRLVTPPASLAVSLDDAKLQLRIDGTAEDALVESWVKGITEHAEHYTGRAFVNQGLRVTLDSFPAAIRLDRSPVVSVESVKFYDANNVLQTLNSADYVVDNVSEPGYIVPAPGKAWPVTADRINAVSVDFTAGYGVDSASVPNGIKLYIIAKLVEQYDANPVKESVQTSYVDRLLDPFVVY